MMWHCKRVYGYAHFTVEFVKGAYLILYAHFFRAEQSPNSSTKIYMYSYYFPIEIFKEKCLYAREEWDCIKRLKCLVSRGYPMGNVDGLNWTLTSEKRIFYRNRTVSRLEKSREHVAVGNIGRHEFHRWNPLLWQLHTKILNELV